VKEWPQNQSFVKTHVLSPEPQPTFLRGEENLKGETPQQITWGGKNIPGNLKDGTKKEKKRGKKQNPKVNRTQWKKRWFNRKKGFPKNPQTLVKRPINPTKEVPRPKMEIWGGPKNPFNGLKNKEIFGWERQGVPINNGKESFGPQGPPQFINGEMEG